MSIRRDYTNGSGYVCPTENAAIGHLDKPKERIPRPARHSGVLHEQELNRMSKPTPMRIQCGSKRIRCKRRGW